MKTLLIATLICLSQIIYAQGPCLNDIQKFCPKIEKNKKSIAKCILDNEAKLSPACKERAKIIKARTAGGDFKQPKAVLNTQVGAKPKANRDAKGNQGNGANLNNQPSGQDVKAACQDSIKKLCSAIKPRHGAIISCLKENISKVTPKCKDTINK